MEVVRETISFQRGLDPKKSIDVGLSHINKIKFESIPEELIQNYIIARYYSKYDGWIYYNYNELEDQFEVIEANRRSTGDEHVIIDKTPIDILIKRIKPFANNMGLFYNKENFSWKKINESLSFQRGQDPKTSLEVGSFYLNKMKWENIPHELLMDWWESSYPSTYVMDPDLREGTLKIYNPPMSLPPSRSIEPYLSEEIKLDDLIKELIDYDHYSNYRYKEDDYTWHKLDENLSFTRGMDAKASLGVGEYRVIENPSFNDIINLKDGFYMITKKYFGGRTSSHSIVLYKNGNKYKIPNIWQGNEENAILDMKYHFESEEIKGKHGVRNLLGNMGDYSQIQKIEDIVPKRINY